MHKANHSHPQVAAFRAWLRTRGKAASTVRHYSGLISPAIRQGIDVTDDTAWAAFVAQYTLASQVQRGLARSQYLAFLRDEPEAPTSSATRPPVPLRQEQQAFARWLVEYAGKSANTASAYSSRVYAFLRAREAHPGFDLESFLWDRPMSYQATLESAWPYYCSWKAEQGETIAPLGLQIPEPLEIVLFRFTIHFRLTVEDLANLTWGDMDYQHSVMGDLIEVHANIERKRTKPLRPIKGRNALEDLARLRAWAMPRHENAPLIPRAPTSLRPAGAKRIKDAVKRGRQTFEKHQQDARALPSSQEPREAQAFTGWDQTAPPRVQAPLGGPDPA